MSKKAKNNAAAASADFEEGKITVVVRCRPFNAREQKLKSGLCIRFAADGQSLKIYEKGVPADKKAPETKENKASSFAFDHAYGLTATQQQIYTDVGLPVLLSSFKGYNTCIFAYGQTGSGKSFAMMGPTGAGAKEELRGITPRLCCDLFAKVAKRTEEAKTLYDAAVQNGVLPQSRPPQISFDVSVSYLEIYQENVKCLLNPKKDKLKVRQHPVTGVYVESLTEIGVDGFDKVLELVTLGDGARQVAATNMNDRSSRSHAIFSIILTQKRTIVTKDGSDMVSEIKAKINLVDLAGSERAKSTGAEGDTLKEGAQINKSLSVLGQVIAGLAEMSTKKTSPSTPGSPAKGLGSTTRAGSPSKVQAVQAPFIPYRDSMLTWLLKESLGGNSKTFMVSTLSPAVVNYEETLSTLRFADRAKNIITRSCVNENPYDKRIRELEEEVARLRAELESKENSLNATVVAPPPPPPVVAMHSSAGVSGVNADSQAKTNQSCCVIM